MPGTTPAKGIRYPLLNEAGDPQLIMAMTFDMDTMATADDALRTTALTQRGAVITNSTTESVAKNAAFKFTFDTVTIDPQGLSNLGVNNDRFTITKAGLYMFGLTLRVFLAGSGGLGISAIEATIAKNTTAAPAVPNYRRHKYPGFTGALTGEDGVSVVAPMVMAAGDFVTAQTFWNGTAAGPATYQPPVFWVLPIALT